MENIRVEYYTADYCGPCKTMVGPISELQAAGWNIEKIDTVKEQARATAAGILGIPTFVIYRDNVPVRRFTGARQKSALEAELKLAAQ